MKSVAVFLIDGFEETEALTTVDILRRGGVEVTVVSLTGKAEVRSSHNITVRTDALFDDVKDNPFDMLIIPGGTRDYITHAGLKELAKKYAEEKKLVSAICAAPTVLAEIGVLKGKRAVCYPGMEKWLKDGGAVVGQDIVETDGNITTAKGPATTPFFALRLLEVLQGRSKAEEVAEAFLIPLIKGASL
ncbi:MAG: DJ-1/PfpI family protein [Synergistaceae bacterium]|nr:DJ-1/PfpI family protein [Synergistaceae bacterium]